MASIVKMIWKGVTWLLILSLAGCAGGGLFYLADKYQWPRWVGALIFITVILTALIALWLRGQILKRRERNFIESVVESDTRSIDIAGNMQARNLSALRQRMSNSVAVLSGSRLRYQGNPLYMLPWYMVLGEEGSGKSSIINRSGLAFALHEDEFEKEVVPTQNCSWLFSDKSVILDTSGRYASSHQTNHDVNEWRFFLKMLAKYKKKEPLNGVVITLPADKLLRGDRQEIQEYGCHVGARLEELTKILKVQVPVYIMITGADCIYGFSAYVEQLEDDEKRQVFGYLDAVGDFSAESINLAFAHCINQLNKKMQQIKGVIGHDLLIFSREISQLSAPVSWFFDSAFGHNFYHGAVIPRGLFLSSAMQEGKETSLCLLNRANGAGNNLKNIDRKDNGLFLYNFFAYLLPSEKYQVNPGAQKIKQQKLSGKIFMLAMVMLSGAVTYGFVLDYLQAKKQIISIENELISCINSMHDNPSVQQAVLSYDSLVNRINTIHLDRFSLYHSLFPFSHQVAHALQYAKNYVVTTFPDKVENPYNEYENYYLLNADTVSSPADEEYAGGSIYLLSSQIINIHDVMDGKKTDKKHLLYKKSDSDYASEQAFERVFLSYLSWQSNHDMLRASAVRLQHQLNNILRKHDSMEWIIDRGTRHAPAVSASSFWGLPLKHDLTVPGCFTEKGYEEIFQVLALIESTDIPTDIRLKLNRFKKAYAYRYQQAWQDFNKQFLSSGNSLGADARYAVALSLKNKNNLFYKLYAKTLYELEAIAVFDITDLPTLYFSQAIVESYWSSQKNSGEDGVLEGEKHLLPAGLLYRQQNPRYSEQLAEGEKAYEQFYQSVVTMISHISLDKTIEGHTDGIPNYAGSDSGTGQALLAVHRLESILLQPEKNRLSTADLLFRNIYAFLRNTLMNQTACHLQDYWESNVISPLKYLPEFQKYAMLFGKGGSVKHFLQGAAFPYVALNANGWHPVKQVDTTLPFNPGFFKFMEAGSWFESGHAREYPVYIKAFPIDTDQQADQVPFKTTLTVQCKDGQQQLVNYNYPASFTFHWKPEICGATRLTFQFNDFLLEKQWPGETGFQDFLMAFQSGYAEFSGDDFPKQAPLLHKRNITKIGVKFEIQGAGPVINRARLAAMGIPDQIVYCRRS